MTIKKQKVDSSFFYLLKYKNGEILFLKNHKSRKFLELIVNSIEEGRHIKYSNHIKNHVRKNKNMPGFLYGISDEDECHLWACFINQ